MFLFLTSSEPDHVARQRGGVLFWMLIVGIGAVVGAVLAFELVIKRLQAQLVVSDELLQASVDQPLDVRASVLNALNIAIDEVVSTTVPVDTLLSVPVEEALQLTAHFDALVPVQTTVLVEDVIPLVQDIDIDTIVEADLLGETFKLPLRGRFPVRADVPVRLAVPIDEEVQMTFTAPIRARLQQNLEVPLQTRITADVPLKTEMSVPVLNDLQVIAELPRENILPVQLNYADLILRLGDIRIHFDPEPAPPLPQISPTPAARAVDTSPPPRPAVSRP